MWISWEEKNIYTSRDFSCGTPLKCCQLEQRGNKRKIFKQIFRKTLSEWEMDGAGSGFFSKEDFGISGTEYSGSVTGLK
jgi:hypothetical protein